MMMSVSGRRKTVVIKESELNFGAPILISVEEATQVFRIGRTQTYGLVMGGQIRSVKIGRRRLVVRDSLQEFVDELVADQCGK